MRDQIASGAMAAGLLLFALHRLDPWQRLPVAFTTPPMPTPLTEQAPRGLLPAPATGLKTVRLAAAGQSPGEGLGMAAGLGAVMLLAGLSAKWWAHKQRRAKVVMHARPGRRYFHQNSKGWKPLIHRRLCHNPYFDFQKKLSEKCNSLADMEEYMKKSLYGVTQIQISTSLKTDSIPWIKVPGLPAQGSDREARQKEQEDQLKENAMYIRKFKNPARFRKMAVIRWEMPEKATRAVTLQELVQAGCHIGHHAAIWNPNMMKYLWTESDGTHIFDLVETAKCLNRACHWAMEAASKGAVFLWVGTKQQAAPLIREAGQRTGMPYCDQRCVGGILTNNCWIQRGIKKLKRMVRENEQGAWQGLSNEMARKNKLKIAGLKRRYEGIKDMQGCPDVVIFVDEVKERALVAEGAAMGTPMIGLIDSASHPRNIELPIPANASSSSSIELIIGKLTEAILKGQALYNATDKGDRYVFEPRYDPWMFSKKRQRQWRKKCLRQPWHKVFYGSYEKFKEAHPYGVINPVMPYDPNFRVGFRNNVL